MNTKKFIGRCLYQADLKPKGGRVFRREDVSTMIEYEIPSLSAADLVRDAVVVMPVDERAYYNARNDPPVQVAYAGWDAGLWRPMLSRQGQPVTVEAYETSLRQMPDYRTRNHRDPLLKARLTSASPKERSLDEKDITNETDFAGDVDWTNKADAIAAHQRAVELLIAVDDEIWCRHPGPVWQVQTSTGFNQKYGVVTLEPDLALYPTQDLFRLDRLRQASELSRARWGKAVVDGAVERMDERFITRDELATVFHTSLSTLLDKGANFTPYMKPAAVAAFSELYLKLKPETPLTPYATTSDDHFVIERMAILGEAFSDQSLPYRLLQLGKEIKTSFRLVEERIRLERNAAPLARPAIDNPMDDDAITSLGRHP